MLPGMPARAGPRPAGYNRMTVADPWGQNAAGMQKETATVTLAPVGTTLSTHTDPVTPITHPPTAGFQVPVATGAPAMPQIVVPAPANATLKDHVFGAVEMPVSVNGPVQPPPLALPNPASWPSPAGAATAFCIAEPAAKAMAAANIRVGRGISVVPWSHGRAAWLVPYRKDVARNFVAPRPISCDEPFVSASRRARCACDRMPSGGPEEPVVLPDRRCRWPRRR